MPIRISVLALCLMILAVTPALSGAGLIRKAGKYAWSTLAEKLESAFGLAGKKASVSAAVRDAPCAVGKAAAAVDSALARGAAAPMTGAAIAATAANASPILSHGDEALAFIWRNKGALAVASTLGTFVARPEEFLSSGENLAASAADSFVHTLPGLAEIMLEHPEAFAALSFGFAVVCCFCLWTAHRLIFKAKR